MKKPVFASFGGECYIKDDNGVVWLIRKTHYKEIPVLAVNWSKVFKDREPGNEEKTWTKV